jgi:hypothetical protein
MATVFLSEQKATCTAQFYNVVKEYVSQRDSDQNSPGIEIEATKIS